MENTLSYLMQTFSEYYSKTEVTLPPRFGRREWGFFFFAGTGMQRHLSFHRGEELKEFLISRAPRHVYYSSAYYQNPDVRPMPKKVEGWLGADLIFDLDDEHLSGMEDKTTAERLEIVKRIVKDQLLNDFLLTDFGFEPKNVRVAFSGGRGYHIHIFDPKVLSLKSPERREIVDYITGLGIDFDRIFIKERFRVQPDKGRGGLKQKIKTLPDESGPGWSGRMIKGIFKILDEMEAISKEGCIKMLQSVKTKKKEVSKDQAGEIYSELFKGEIGQRGADTIRKKKEIDIFSTDPKRDTFLELVRQRVSVKMAGETDEPVTVDTKRLIRLPGSLHGKTGLKVVPLTVEELEEFEPLRDAVAFSAEPIKVSLNQELKFEIGGNKYDLKTGEHELPKFAGIYLMCRGVAEISY